MIYVVIAIIGVILSVCANWAIYNLAYFPRNIGPWHRAPEGVVPRGALDWIPLWGWLRLRRESTIHGKYFWIRPFAIELFFPLFLIWLYRFELGGGLLVDGAMTHVVDEPIRWLHFGIHAVLIWLLLVATFIDFDERCIPDTITLPGTLGALIGSAVFPHWHLYTIQPDPTDVVPLHPASPEVWNLSWNGTVGLGLGLLSFGVWCFALMDRRLILRRGWRKGIQYFLAALFRHWTWKLIVAIWFLGSIAIWIGYEMLPLAHWQSLFTSLIGMTLGCAVVWSIRIIARMAMGVEAMGFGDVTLMAMVGAFLGWQPVWLAFFLAPIMAVLIVLIAWMLTGDKATPFGPYLAAGTLAVLIGWTYLWNDWAVPRLMMLGPFLLPGFLGFLFLLGGTLWFWLLIKRMLLR